MSGDGYCVRACDGYYFPLIKSSLISGQRACEFACPSGRVQLYEGASIEEARNAKGERYSALPAAFSFREKATAGCSCSDLSASQNDALRLSMEDPTLRSGDVVVGETGAFVYSRTRLVSLSHASRQIQARLRNLLPRDIARGEGRVQEGAIALNKAQRRTK